MRRLTATEAARQFADLLDSVEHSGETVVVERRGRAIAAISPAAAASGRSLKELLRKQKVDSTWADELSEVRGLLTSQERRWSG
jgi:prevent-host-death family protein